MDIKEEKMIIIFSWLLEFRFSTPKILSMSLEHNKNTSIFFSSLIKNEFVKVVKNVHTNKERFFMLTKQGVDFLEARGFDVENAVTKKARFERYSMVLHDVAVQHFIALKKEAHLEVIWDKNIIKIERNCRPDALMKMNNGHWVVLEYERWRKSLARIFTSFVNHANQISQENYGGVYFVFNTKLDHDHYISLFNYEQWPLFSKDTRTGKMTHNGKYFQPNEVENLRDCFIFEIMGCE